MDNQDQKEEKDDPSIISYPYQLVLAQLMGIPINQVSQALQPFQNMIIIAPQESNLPPPLIIPPQNRSPDTSPISTPNLSSDSEDDLQPLTKRQKIDHTHSGPCKEYTTYSYLLLSSGREFYFNSTDGNNILTPLHIEPNLFIRKLLSHIPRGLQDALLFLSDFATDDKTIVIDVDRVSEPVENKEDVTELDLSTLFSREQMIMAYIRELRLRRAFRLVLQRWRIWKIDKKHTPEVDPITLSLPEKEIYVYDVSVSKKFTFEARSLANYIETRLSYNEGGFASPIFPKNPWTNADFTYYQLLSIYYQLKSYGELRWGLITLQKYHFDLMKWHNYHRSTLTLQAIKNCLRLLDTSDARDILEDFILDQLEDTGTIVTEYVTNAYRITMIKDPDHWYLQYWKEMAWVWYEAEHFSRNRRRYVNARCAKIIRHQTKFLNELVQKKWIPPPS